MTSYAGCSTPQGSCGPSANEVVLDVGTAGATAVVQMTFDVQVNAGAGGLAICYGRGYWH